MRLWINTGPGNKASLVSNERVSSIFPSFPHILCTNLQCDTTANINEQLEYNRVIQELKDVEAIIAEDEAGGVGSLTELESDLKNEEANLADKKSNAEELQTLMNAVRSMVFVLKTHSQ